MNSNLVLVLALASFAASASPLITNLGALNRVYGSTVSETIVAPYHRTGSVTIPCGKSIHLIRNNINPVTSCDLSHSASFLGTTGADYNTYRGDLEAGFVGAPTVAYQGALGSGLPGTDSGSYKEVLRTGLLGTTAGACPPHLGSALFGVTTGVYPEAAGNGLVETGVHPGSGLTEIFFGACSGAKAATGLRVLGSGAGPFPRSLTGSNLCV